MKCYLHMTEAESQTTIANDLIQLSSHQLVSPRLCEHLTTSVTSACVFVCAMDSKKTFVFCVYVQWEMAKSLDNLLGVWLGYRGTERSMRRRGDFVTKIDFTYTFILLQFYRGFYNLSWCSKVSSLKLMWHYIYANILYKSK